MCETPQSELESVLSSNRESLMQLESVIQDLYERTQSIRQPKPTDTIDGESNKKTIEPNLVDRLRSRTSRINSSTERINKILQELIL